MASASASISRTRGRSIAAQAMSTTMKVVANEALHCKAKAKKPLPPARR